MTAVKNSIHYSPELVPERCRSEISGQVRVSTNRDLIFLTIDEFQITPTVIPIAIWREVVKMVDNSIEVAEKEIGRPKCLLRFPTGVSSHSDPETDG